MESRQRYSCLYLRVDDVHCLLDCGEGASNTHFEEVKKPDKLDFVFITHMHPDHVSGLFMMIQFLSMHKRQKKLQIFLPESAERFTKTLEMFYLFPQALSFELEILPAQDVAKYYPFLQPFNTDHLQRYQTMEQPNLMQSLGVNIIYNGGEKRICYTSDIKTLSAIKEHIQGCDICVVDGVHTPIDEFIELQNWVKGHIYVTHGYTEETARHLLIHNQKYKLAKEGQAIKL